MRAVNLIPVDQREGAGSLTGRSGGAALLVVALVAGLAVLAVMYGKAHRSESSSRSELVTVNAELANARAQVGKMAPYTNFIAMANQRVQTLSGLVVSRFDWSHAFDELGRVLPHDVALTALHGQVGSATGSGSGSGSSSSTAGASATPTSVTPPGSTPVFTVTGCTTSQSEVAQTLQRLRLIDGVFDVELQSSVKSPKSGSGSGGSGASAASTGCQPGTATFSAQITFAALPSAPATNAPGASTAAGSPASGAGTGQSGTAATPVSSQGGSR
jgi:Tfp pilus assembly protein PilN